MNTRVKALRTQPRIKACLALSCMTLLAPPALAQLAPDAGPATDCLFDWAQHQYPQLFAPAGQASKVRDGGYYRDYAVQQIRLSAANGRLWLQARLAPTAQELGTVNDWLAESGCGGADVVAPQVLFTSVSDGAVEVAHNARLAVAFSEPILASRLDEALVVTRDDGVRVTGSVRYEPEESVLSFVPATPYDANRRYTARVTPQLRDVSGNALAAPYEWTFHTAPEKRQLSEQQQRIQWLLDRALWRHAIPGGSVAVMLPESEVWTAAGGVADRATRAPMTATHVMKMGSNTKTFVATVILHMVDKGLVDLDAPIDRYLGAEMRAHLSFYVGRGITVRQLLNHTSHTISFTDDPEWGAAFVSDPYKRYTPEQLLEIADRNAWLYNVHELGTFYYSNTNYILLGMLIGKLGPQDYAGAIRTQLLEPLGLDSAVVPEIGQAQPPAGTATGYWVDGQGQFHDVTIKDPSTVWASGDMLSNVADLARWAMDMGQGKTLSAELQQQRLQFVPMNATLEYGLGVVRDRQANLIGHQGGIIGYTSQSYYVVEEAAAVGFLYNRTLAMPDYSAVMTYDVLRTLWPQRYQWLTTHPVAAAPTQRALHTPTERRVGLLHEY